MPFVKIFERDPMAVFKAFAMTATAALLVEFIPTDVKADLVSWARNAFIKEPPFILPHARVPITLVLVALIAIVVAVEYRQKIWCMLFFNCVPQTRSHHTAAVIWLHGLGDRPENFLWLQKHIGLCHVKWVLPQAEVREISAIRAMVQSTGVTQSSTRAAWIDMHAMPITRSEPIDKVELDRAVERILAIIDSQVADGIAPERIVVGGFSQGACVAAWAVSRCAHKLGGCALWSGYVGDKAVELTAALRASRNVATRFTYGHGSVDPTVLPECGEVFVAALEQAGVGVDARVFEGVKHGCSHEQVEALKDLVYDVAPTRAGERYAKPKDL